MVASAVAIAPQPRRGFFLLFVAKDRAPRHLCVGCTQLSEVDGGTDTLSESSSASSLPLDGTDDPIVTVVEYAVVCDTAAAADIIAQAMLYVACW